MPIGDDQLQHLELARELCRLFNSRYGNLFPIPKPILGKKVTVFGWFFASVPYQCENASYSKSRAYYIYYYFQSWSE